MGLASPTSPPAAHACARAAARGQHVPPPLALLRPPTSQNAPPSVQASGTVRSAITDVRSAARARSSAPSRSSSVSSSLGVAIRRRGRVRCPVDLDPVQADVAEEVVEGHAPPGRPAGGRSPRTRRCRRGRQPACARAPSCGARSSTSGRTPSPTKAITSPARRAIRALAPCAGRLVAHAREAVLAVEGRDPLGQPVDVQLAREAAGGGSGRSRPGPRPG